MRALSNDSSAVLAASTRELVGAPCTCFDRVEAQASAFNPGARAAAARLRAFRAATLRNNLLANGLAAHRSRDTILFVSRTGSRRVAINEASIMSRLRAEAAGVQRVVLELLPFVRRELMRSRELTPPVLKKGAALRGRPCQGRLPVWPRDAAPVHRAPQDRAPAHR